MKSKFSLSWIFALIVLLLMAATIFFSNFFASSGDTAIGLIWASISTILTLGIVFALVRVKQTSNRFAFHRAAILELILGGVAVAVLAFNIYASNHFFNVLARQPQISLDVDNQLSQMDDMFQNYSTYVSRRVKSYEHELDAAILAKSYDPTTYKNYGLDQVSKETLMVSFQSDISCESTQDDRAKWQDEMRRSTSMIGILTLLPRTNEISRIMNETRDALRSLDKARNEGRNGENWDYDLTYNDQLLSHFTTKADFNFVGVVVILILFLIILLPYWMAPRNEMHHGIRSALKGPRNTNIGGGTIDL